VTITAGRFLENANSNAYEGAWIIVVGTHTTNLEKVRKKFAKEIFNLTLFAAKYCLW
jgi:putative N-acetylmannosamine-6-phosphate epimerase